MAGIDRELLIEISGGESEAADLLRLFFSSVRDVMTSLESAVQSRDRGATNRAAHQIAGAAGTCGCAEMEENARAIETEVDTRSWPELQSRVAALADLLDRVEAEARDLFPAFAKGSSA